MTPDDRGESGHSAPTLAGEDRGLAIPELPLLEDPLGSLEFRLRAAADARENPPFVVAGRRAFAAGTAVGGVAEVWAHPLRLMAGLTVSDAAADSVTVTPLGVERRLRAGVSVVLERVVVPQEAPACVVEWVAVERTVEVEIGWECDLWLPAPQPPAAPGALRWRRSARGLVVAGPRDDRAVFAFSGSPDTLSSLDVADASSSNGAPRVRVRARARLPRRVPVRLAIAGASGDAALRRALAAADRTAGATRARRGSAERLITQGLSLSAPAPAAVQALEWAKLGLEGRLAEAPGVGRSLLNGENGPGAAPFGSTPASPPAFGGPQGVRGALAACGAGSFRIARDVLLFLGRHLDPSGRALRECSTAGDPRHDDPLATPLYLLLAARYLAWTGDTGTLRAEWPRILRARDAALQDDQGNGHGPLLGHALAELADAAEAVGAREATPELRRAAEARGGRPWVAERGLDTVVGALVHGSLGAEPDAPRGRLVLRPEPPDAWEWFRVAELAVGGAGVSMDYRRKRDRHTFRLTQERGPAPLRVIFEPRLPGRRLARAVVDGVDAELDARGRGDKLLVPVQVVLDHRREIVLELDGGGELERRTQ